MRNSWQALKCGTGCRYEIVIHNYLSISKFGLCGALIGNYFESRRSKWCSREVRLISKSRAFVAETVLSREAMFLGTTTFYLNMTDLDRIRALKCAEVFAGANFIARRRFHDHAHGSYSVDLQSDTDTGLISGIRGKH